MPVVLIMGLETVVGVGPISAPVYAWINFGIIVGVIALVWIGIKKFVPTQDE